MQLVMATAGNGLVIKTTDFSASASPETISVVDNQGQGLPESWGGTNLQFVAASLWFSRNSLDAVEGPAPEWPESSWAEPEPERAAEVIRIPVTVFQVQGTTVDPNETIPIQVQNASKFWANKIEGLRLVWDNQVTPTPICDPAVTLGNACATEPRTHLDTFYVPSSCSLPTIGWVTLTLRFPNAPGLNNKGVKLLFTNSLLWDPPLLTIGNPIEVVAFYEPDGSCDAGNVVVMSNLAFNTVLAHAIGHVFGLDDLAGKQAAGPPGNQLGNNLMCSNDAHIARRLPSKVPI